MPREYTVSFDNVAVSAAQDLLQIKGGTGKLVRILEVWAECPDQTLATNQNLRLRCRYLPSTVTDGTGGSTPTPVKVDPGDAAATFTALANNTTQATTTGTAVVLEARGANLYAGFDYMFPRPPIVGAGASFTFELETAPSGTVHLSGGALVEEIG